MQEDGFTLAGIRGSRHQWSERSTWVWQWALPGLLLVCEELMDRLLGVETWTDAVKRSIPSPAFGGAFSWAVAGLVRGTCPSASALVHLLVVHAASGAQPP